MKVYTFEEGKRVREFYTLPSVKKAALIVAKATNRPVLITGVSKPSYRQDWYTAYPNGVFVTDRLGFTADA